MKVNVLAFGIAKDIFGRSSIDIELSENATVGVLRTKLQEHYPRLEKLSSFMIAVNNEYADNHNTLQQHDEIAIIPPVSGG